MTGADGRPDASRIAEMQRLRLLSAMSEVCVQRGCANVTVAHVVEHAGVSRRTFYELFTDCHDCLLAALEQGVKEACERVLPAYRSERSWRLQIRAALAALLSFFDEKPLVGRLLVVEWLGTGTRALGRRRQVVAQLVRAVERGRGKRTGADSPAAPLVGEGVVGGVLAILHRRMLACEGGSLMDLLNPLMFTIVLPYLGPAAARGELEQRVTAMVSGRAPVGNPLKDLGIRLSYRTMRVLHAIGERPGASNREIALLAGVRDQGQASKVLARLADRGLVENARQSDQRGAPNAWTLTERGRELLSALSGG